MTDFDKLQANSSSHTKGTISLVNEMGAKRWFFECGHMNKTRNDWYLGLVATIIM